MECASLVADVAGTYISGKSNSAPPIFQTCEYLNVSICPATVPGNVSAMYFKLHVGGNYNHVLMRLEPSEYMYMYLPLNILLADMLVAVE